MTERLSIDLEAILGPRPAAGGARGARPLPRARQLQLLEELGARRPRKNGRRKNRAKRKTEAVKRLERVADGSFPARPVRKALGQWHYLLTTILEDIRDAREPRKELKLGAWIKARGDVLHRAELNVSHLLKTFELEHIET